MDRLESMLIVREVARAGSLSAAGRSLRMPLASVSRKVSELEAYLGAQLFTRTSRKLTLTAAGETYVLACRRILDDIGEAERLVSGEYQVPKGELVVTAPVAFGRLHVLPVATAFLKAYPQIDLRLHLVENTLNLAEDHIDIALRIGALPDSQLHARKIGATRRLVCASPDYLAAHGTPVTPGDLARHDAIVLESLSSAQGWTFRQGRHEVFAPVHARLSVNVTQAAIDAAVEGTGLVRVLGYQVASEVKAGKLVPVLEDHELDPWPIHLVYLAQGPLPQKVRAFLDWATPRLKDRLSAP